MWKKLGGKRKLELDDKMTIKEEQEFREILRHLTFEQKLTLQRMLEDFLQGSSQFPSDACQATA